ncbi:hypothetical protein FNH05_13635 [Amycolatopsis rhizosphaerae]|uniref:Uncharacterized protein n=1 Tax=Amycolatopsis rhizosphaerae TaxID=2053003 RepID=A0A558CTP0_9PSEU|nr:hypothetical protein [Amycolatopsis rhizosphaerae]TVT52062.1 hypothetical protein FNH05_13635 [Amycolatopsis rhizosphaerae]
MGVAMGLADAVERVQQRQSPQLGQHELGTFGEFGPLGDRVAEQPGQQGVQLVAETPLAGRDGVRDTFRASPLLIPDKGTLS